MSDHLPLDEALAFAEQRCLELFGARSSPVEPRQPQPTLAVDNPAPAPSDVSPVPLPVIVADTSKLATEVETIAQAAIDQIKELLKHPLDRNDPNFAALLRFLSSTYNTSMTTIARTDDTRLKQQAVSKLDYLYERAAEERRKREARRTIEHMPAERPDGGAA